MATPPWPIPQPVQAEIDNMQNSLVRIENRVTQGATQTNIHLTELRNELDAHLSDTDQRLAAVSERTEGVDRNIVRLRELVDERLTTLNNISFNIFNVLSLVAWKEIFFVIYIRSILKVLAVVTVSLYTIIYFTSWSPSQHMEGWAEDYTALHGSAYSDKSPYTSSVYAPAIPITTHHSLTSLGNVDPSHSAISTVQGMQSFSPSILLARSTGVNTNFQGTQNSTSKYWWWQRLAFTPIATPTSTAVTEDAEEVAKLKEISSLMKDAIEQLKEKVASSVLTSKAAMDAKDGREEIAKDAEASAEEVLESERILRELIDRFSSSIDDYLSARANSIREEE